MLYRTSAIPRIALDIEPGTLVVHPSGAVQAHGRSTSGTEVTVAYDQGRLEIREQSGSDLRILVDAQIGPASHGDLLIRQVCELTGLTVGGGIPDRRIERRADSPLTHIRALGPELVIWEQSLILSAEEAAPYLEALRTAIPNAAVLETRWEREPSKPWRMRLAPADEPSRSSPPLFLIPRAEEAAIAALTERTALTPGEIDTLCPTNIRLSHRWDSHHLRRDAEMRSEALTRQFGRTITVHETPSTVVSTRVDMTNATARNDALLLAKITTEMFAKIYEGVDLATGKTVGDQFAAPRWYLPSLARWAAAAPDRYITVAEQAGAWIGYRPVRTPL